MNAPVMHAVAVAVLVVSAAAVGWWRVEIASAALAIESAKAEQVSRDVARVMELRASGGIAQGRRPDADLVARVQDALLASGLPIGACSGVQPRSDLAQSDGVRVQSVQVTLNGLAPADLGTWLSAWRTPDQPWKVTELQMVHQPIPSGAGLDLNRYDITVALAAPYLEDQP